MLVLRADCDAIIGIVPFCAGSHQEVLCNVGLNVKVFPGRLRQVESYHQRL